MARKSIEGQIDMFELFGSVEELEENVKGVPELYDLPKEQAVQEAPAAMEMWQPSAAPVMQRSFRSDEKKSTAVVAYLDYNMVYLQDWEKKPVIYQFEHARDAVNFYVSQMERFLCDKTGKVQKEQEALQEASVIKWTGETES